MELSRIRYENIKEYGSNDLRKKLDSKDPEIIWLKPIIKTELDIRSIINTSAEWGITHVAALENRTNTTQLYKMKVLAEAEHREGCNLQRTSLLKKLQATLHRLERKTGIQMRYDAGDDLWIPFESYNPSKHAPNRQHQIKGVPIDPCLPFSFDNIQNDDRDPLEIADWWGRPYVVSGLDSYKKVRYDVRRLDGGAWDRSTWIGTSTDLLEAVELAWEHNARAWSCLFA